MIPVVLALMLAASVLMVTAAVALAPSRSASVAVQARTGAGRAATVSRLSGFNPDGAHEPGYVSRKWADWQHAWSHVAARGGMSGWAKWLPGAMIVGPLLLLVLISILSGSIPFAIFAAVIPAGMIWMWLSGRGRKYDLMIENQLGGFLTSFNMYVEAGEEPINALYAAVESSQPELRSVLRPLTDAIDNNVPPAEALAELKASTDNPILGELATNVRIALRSGQNLSTQLSMLADMVRLQAENRMEAERELLVPRAISMLVISMGPATYLAIWLGMPDWHASWSSSLMGYAASLLAFAMNGLGAWLVFRVLTKLNRTTA